LNRGTGFTLLELVITLALISIIGLLGIANMSFLDCVLVRAEIDKLEMICRYLQRCAQASNVQELLQFDLARHAYTFQGTTEYLPWRVKFGRGTAEKPITFVGNRIAFFPTGIQQAGAVYMRDVSGSYRYALTSPVCQVSYLRKYRYDGTWNLIE
jgi:prepilin-type N-terminal cleavage/methylation domain-containing protein